MTFQAQEFTGADLYIMISSMMPHSKFGCNSDCRGKKTQSPNAVKARTLRIILYQLTNRDRVHSSQQCLITNAGERGLLWIFLCTARRKESRKKNCNQTSSRSIRNLRFYRWLIQQLQVFVHDTHRIIHLGRRHSDQVVRYFHNSLLRAQTDQLRMGDKIESSD